MSLEFGWISYFVTVFWFLLFINAVNLIDGLDGLAAGVCFFASLVMVFLLTINGNFLYVMLFSSLAGVLLGFLWYNFNPASIFMGDGGSYFLGYTIAGLSIMCSSKSHVGTVMLIPVLAMGVPIFDTILSPVRRFIIGSGMFKADKRHIHHKLVEIGISTRKVVYIIYGISVCLCALALLLVNLRDEQVGVFLIVLGAALLVFIRRLGYFEYFASDKIFGWLKDITDEVGISKDRRTFLSIQMSIAASDTMYQLWRSVIQAAEKIHLSAMALELDPGAFGGSFLPTLTWENGVKGESVEEEKNGHSLRLEAPIVLNGKVYATLHLSKSLEHWNCDRLVLRRIEQVRRSISSGLEKIALRSSTSPEVLEDRRRPDNHNTKKWKGHERRKG